MIYRLLADGGDELFGDDYFADLYEDSSRGRPTVPGRMLATVMVSQSFKGLSDREAVDRVTRDLAWQAAAGLEVGAESFDHTVPTTFHRSTEIATNGGTRWRSRRWW